MKKASYKLGVIGFGLIFNFSAVAQGGDPELLCVDDKVEDLVAVPNTSWLIGSGLGHAGSDGSFEGGGLFLIDTDNTSIESVELDLSPDLVAAAPYDQCPGPADAEKFSAHGLGLKANDDGSQDLFVVNHGGRESIEIFRVTPTDSKPELSWIGCVLSPENSLPNGVAARAGGSVVVSSSGSSLGTYMEDAKAGKPTGAVYEWQRSTGWTEIENSSFSINNGIELSDDGNWAFVAAWGERSVVHLPLDPSLGQPQKIELEFMPDNIRRTHDGPISATGHITSLEEVTGCMADENQNCYIDYVAVEIDPESLELTPLYEGKGTEDFSAATVTVKADDALWMGSFLSSCVAKFPVAQED